jgi:hypothetical protein
VLRVAAEQFQAWVKEQAGWGAPIVEAPKGRRDEFVEPHFKGAAPDQLVLILKAREPARITTAIGDRMNSRAVSARDSSVPRGKTAKNPVQAVLQAETGRPSD